MHFQQTVTVSNKGGDPAFTPVLTVSLPKVLDANSDARWFYTKLPVRQTPPECQIREDDGVISCDIYGPLKPGKVQKLKITYDVTNLESFTEQILWDKIEVSSSSNRELDHADNLGK